MMGLDGKTAEFQVNGDILQWRYKGESVWLNLYDLTTLKGADGTDGKDGADGQDGADGRENGADGKTVEVRKTDSAVQWRYEGEEWQDLVALSDITGPAGQDGEDGKTVEFRVDGDTLQWRYTGESVWLNLYDLSMLKGADGKDGTDGKDGVNGTNGKDGVNGQDGANGTDGKTPELRVNGNTLQWRYAGESNWQDLYDLSALKGADGVNGADRTKRNLFWIFLCSGKQHATKQYPFVQWTNK